jgi:hypothetical protein
MKLIVFHQGFTVVYLKVNKDMWTLKGHNVFGSNRFVLEESDKVSTTDCKTIIYQMPVESFTLAGPEPLEQNEG